MHVSILDNFLYLNFDLSSSLKVKCDGIGLLSWPNSDPLVDRRLRNLSDLEYLSFKVTEGQM